MHIEACAPGETLVIDSSADAVVAIAGTGTNLASSLAGARAKFVPTVVIALGDVASDVAVRLSHPILDTIVYGEPEHVVHALGRWLVDRVTGKRLAMAANFAFVRRAAAEESIKATAFQNAVIGVVAVIPGADMPLMTANQAKMILQIAAAYGEPLGIERMKELAAVVGGGFTLRAIARQLLDFVPGFGWALKGVIGYSGTLAMGYAALEYFEEGGDVRGLASRVKQARDRAIDTARERISRGGPAEEPLPAHAYVVAGSGGRVPDAPPSLPSPEESAEDTER